MASPGASARKLVVCLALGAVAAAADEVPDAELFEYLGTWEESDGEWIALLDWQEDEEPQGEPELNEDEKDER